MRLGEFCSHLEKATDEATACSLGDNREEQGLRKMVFPIWLQPGQEPPDVNEELAQMQALKAAAPEQVRWRSLRAPVDILSVSISINMRTTVRSWAMTEYDRTNEPRNLCALRGTRGQALPARPSGRFCKQRTSVLWECRS